MPFNFKKNVAAMKTIVQQKRKIRKLKPKIKAAQSLNRAMRGGHVSGLSSTAAGRLASDPKKFR